MLKLHKETKQLKLFSIIFTFTIVVGVVDVVAFYTRTHDMREYL